jgi:hypothetical protein
MAIVTLQRGRKSNKPNEWRALPIEVGPGDADQFWKHVQRSEGCWLWTGEMGERGYGKFKGHCASRYSFALSYYPPPIDYHVCHTCDNPSCVRPDHLVIGMGLENNRDMVNKGRQRFAPNTNPVNQKHDAAVLDILNLGKTGMGLFDIAKHLRLPVEIVRRTRARFTVAEGGSAKFGEPKFRIKNQLKR